jgi:hypothetical protein
VPYAPQEYDQLKQQLADIPDVSRFVIHVGDIKRGQPLCIEALYESVASVLALSPRPLFIIPGDNEWNDCLVPTEAWKLWTKHFLRFDQHWVHDLRVFRQLEREENFSMIDKGVLLVGVNIVGGRLHDAAEWKERHAQNLAWVRENVERFGTESKCLVLFGHATPTATHDDFFGPFSDLCKTYGKPVLYLHGDGHRWVQDRPFAAQNILRIQVDQGGIAPPVIVTIHEEGETFRFDRRLMAK